MHFAVTDSWTKCNVDVGIVEFLTTESLSSKAFAAPSIGTPIIHNLYLIAFFNSEAVFSAMYSDPKVEFQQCIVLWRTRLLVSCSSISIFLYVNGMLFYFVHGWHQQKHLSALTFLLAQAVLAVYPLLYCHIIII